MLFRMEFNFRSPWTLDFIGPWIHSELECNIILGGHWTLDFIEPWIILACLFWMDLFLGALGLR